MMLMGNVGHPVEYWAGSAAMMQAELELCEGAENHLPSLVTLQGLESVIAGLEEKSVVVEGEC